MRQLRAFAGVAAGLVLLLAACAPTAANKKVPPAPPEFYAGTQAAIYATVVQAISTSPGLDNSNGWIITQSDSVGGFVRAQTVVQPPLLSAYTEAISIVIVSQEQKRTQVVIQGTSGAHDLAQRIRSALTAKFGAPTSG